MDILNKSNLKEFLLTLEKKSYPMKPCSEDELTKLKYCSPTKTLPSNYLDFMGELGNGAEFLIGTHYTMKYIVELKEWAVELLEENSFSKKLTDNQFVFMMHQGYMFWFFNLDEGDNPSVYLYDESFDLTEFKKVSDTLSEYLISLYD